MYLAEGESWQLKNLMSTSMLTIRPYPLLGACLEARLQVDSALRQVGIRYHRCPGPGECDSSNYLSGILLNRQVPELVSQRRRWLNGSFFAAIHSTFHFGYLYRSS